MDILFPVESPPCVSSILISDKMYTGTAVHMIVYNKPSNATRNVIGGGVQFLHARGVLLWDRIIYIKHSVIYNTKCAVFCRTASYADIQAKEAELLATAERADNKSQTRREKVATKRRTEEITDSKASTKLLKVCA